MNNPYSYIEFPVYDLRMTLVLANKCADGILISSDRIGNGFYDDGTPTSRDDILKTYSINDRIVYGLSGRNLTNPEYVNNYINKHGDFSRLSIVESSGKILALTASFMSSFGLAVPELHVVVAGINEDNSLDIREVYLVKGKPVFLSQKHFGAVGYTDFATDKFVHLYTDKTQSLEVLPLQQEVFNSTAKAYPKDVGKKLDSWLITTKGIIDLNEQETIQKTN